MQKQKRSLKLYINFLIANQNRCSGLELSRASPVEDMCHDSVSRWLSSSNFTQSDLWNQVKRLVDIKTGYLLCDDILHTLLNKQYLRVNEPVKKHYSGNVHGLVNGICLVNLLWMSREEFIDIDYQVAR